MAQVNRMVEYVTKEYCLDRKKGYISGKVCDLKMVTITKDVAEMKREIKGINTKLDNHMVHMAADISEIKTTLLLMSKVPKDKITEWSKFIISGLVGIIGTLIMVIKMWSV